MALSQESFDSLANATPSEAQEMMYSMVDALNLNPNLNEIISMLENNGVILELTTDLTYQICRKRPKDQ